MHHPTHSIAHTTSFCYTSRGALSGTRNSSMGPPCMIDQTTNRTMSECWLERDINLLSTWYAYCPCTFFISHRLILAKPVAEQRRARGRPPGWHLYRGGNFSHKHMSTTPIGEPIYIYIWPRAAIPPAPPLCKTRFELFFFLKNMKKVFPSCKYGTLLFPIYNVSPLSTMTKRKPRLTKRVIPTLKVSISSAEKCLPSWIKIWRPFQGRV